MAATYGSISRKAYGSATTTSTNVPSGTTSGDHLLYVQINANSGTAVTVGLPAGITRLSGYTPQTGTDGSFGWRLDIGEVIADGTTSYSTTHSSTNTETLMIRTTGSGTLSVDVFSQANRVSPPGEVVTAGSVTTTESSDQLYFISLNWDEVAYTPPTGMTERQDSLFLYLASQSLSSSGATGTRTIGSSTTNPWFANLIAIKDVSGGGGSQSITGALYTNSNTFYGATVAPGTATVSGGLFTNSQTFYGATVGRGAVNIGGALYTNSSSFYGGTVSASYTIQGALFTDGDTFYGATVSPGSVAINGALFSNSNAFYAAAVSQDGAPQNISGALYSNTQTVYAASVAAKYSVAGALYSDPDTFFAATVSQPVTQNISGARYDNDNSFFGAVVGGKRDTGGSGNAVKRRRNINDDPEAFAELLEEWREKKRNKQAEDEEKQEVSQPESDTIGPELYRQLLALEQAYERSMEAAEKLVSKRNVRAAMTAAKELEDAQAAYQSFLDEEDEEIIALFAA